MKIFSPISETPDIRSSIKAANFDRRSMKIVKTKSARLASLSSPAYLSKEAQTFSSIGKTGDVFPKTAKTPSPKN